MYIVHHAHLKSQRHEGEHCMAAADASLGIHGFEVCLRRLEPGEHSGELRHHGERVVLVLAGCGKLLIDGGPQRFQAPCTVIVPPHRSAQFVNHGSEVLQMVEVRATTPSAADPLP